jgi:hypothetical protein
MRMMMEMSESQDALYAALAKARMDFGTVRRTKTARIQSDKASYTYTYAPLEDCLEAINKALGENGLALIGGAEYSDDGHLLVVTRLGHASGQWVQTRLDMGVYKSVREMGSMLTYGRRFGICLTVQIQADDDDDGEAAEATIELRRPARTSSERRSSRPETPRPDETSDREGIVLLLEQIRNAMKRLVPGDTPQDKGRLSMLIRETFGVNGWSAVKQLKIQALQAGYAQLLDAIEAWVPEEPADEDVPLHEAHDGDTPETAAVESPPAPSTAEPPAPLATTEQIAKLRTLAQEIGDDAYADIQDVLEHNKPGLPLDAHDAVQQRLKVRLETKLAKAKAVKAEDTGTQVNRAGALDRR